MNDAPLDEASQKVDLSKRIGTPDGFFVILPELAGFSASEVQFLFTAGLLS